MGKKVKKSEEVTPDLLRTYIIKFHPEEEEVSRCGLVPFLTVLSLIAQSPLW